MKKSIVTILIVALAIALGTGLVFAASSPEASYAKVAGWNCAGGAGCGFVDADGDGVCDNYGTSACNHGGAASSSSSAVVDAAYTGNGCGYVDADGDGVCDNFGTSACNHSGAAGGAQGSGLQNGYGHHGENHGGGHCGRF